MTYHVSQGIVRYSGSNSIVIEADQGISDFYRSLIPKAYFAQKPRYPAHITVVRSEKESPVHTEHWLKYDHQPISFLYDPYIQKGSGGNKGYFWLNILCKDLEIMRKELGLPVRSQYTKPPVGFDKFFHMTIANQNYSLWLQTTIDGK